MELEQSNGTIYGARYYTVIPKFPAHASTWFKPEWEAMVGWCVTTFDPTPEDGVWTPNARWYVNNAKFWFRDLEDVTLFVLRWS
jgi:hypothetical protein